MKFNWGHKIALSFTAFAALMIFMVVKSFQQNIDLVAEDYYLQELTYQDQIDRIKNAKALSEAFSATVKGGEILLKYPKDLNPNRVTGKVVLYRPSYAALDQEFEVKANPNGEQLLAPSKLLPGKYRLKIQASTDIEYYQELELFIP
jgi:nitrogen fixation protein FixH